MRPDNRFLSQQWAWEHLGAATPLPRPGKPSRAPKPIKLIPPGARDIVIAVIDSGVNAHAELATHLLPPLTVFPGDIRDDDDHGTPLAGTICGITNYRSEIGGASKVKILPVKFCSQQSPPSADRGANAIRVALENEPTPDVIVLAWDCGYNSVALGTAIADAGKAGAVVVVAAGNQGLNNDLYPNWPANYGSLDHVITVMATDKDGQRASFSNFGETTVHIAAPGVDILSTVPYFSTPTAGATIPVGYRFHRGTSAATGYVAGLAALIRVYNPSWTPAQVKNHLIASKKPVSSLERLCKSGGIADYGRAI